MSYTLIKIEETTDRQGNPEAFVQVLFQDEATGAAIPYAQWLSGPSYDAWKADPATLDAIIASWEPLARQQYYDSSAITPRQARLALLNAGMLDAVEVWIATQPRAVQIEWAHANEIRRDWPPVVAFAAANEISDADLDALFELAAAL